MPFNIMDFILQTMSHLGVLSSKNKTNGFFGKVLKNPFVLSKLEFTYKIFR